MPEELIRGSQWWVFSPFRVAQELSSCQLLPNLMTRAYWINLFSCLETTFVSRIWLHLTYFKVTFGAKFKWGSVLGHSRHKKGSKWAFLSQRWLKPRFSFHLVTHRLTSKSALLIHKKIKRKLFLFNTLPQEHSDIYESLLLYWHHSWSHLNNA